MNDIFMANLMADRPIEVKEAHKVPTRKLRLINGSTSKLIIEYLFENGVTSSKKLKEALNLKHHAMGYLNPHIRNGRVICENKMYSINPDMTRADFGLSDD